MKFDRWEKICLTPMMVEDLKNLRLNHPVNGAVMTANDISIAIGNHRAWLSQIKTMRLKTIKRSEINAIFKELLGNNALNSEEYISFSNLYLNDRSTFSKIGNVLFHHLKMHLINHDFDFCTIGEQTRSIFTTLCILDGIEADTATCDKILATLYYDYIARDSMDFDSFYNYMIEYIV